MKDIEIEECYVCAHCIGETFLKREIKKKGEEQICYYCEDEYLCYTIDQVADRVEQAFEVHYQRTETDPSGYEYTMHVDKESSYEWERRGVQTLYAIMDAIMSTERIAEDIKSVLRERHYDFDDAGMGESEFEDGAHYERKYIGDESWQTEWDKFERTLKRESRYFNRACIDHLQSIFGDLNELRTSAKSPVIAIAGPETTYKSFYRARVYQADDRLKTALESPAAQLGPPPALLAAAGRMNARGISVFYGANNPAVSLAEVRPPVGCKVVIAKFELTRKLRLLDLAALQDLEQKGSIFDDGYARRLEKATFLKNLSTRITAPVMPGSEDFEYLPTQAIADFLSSNTDLDLDGILFPSVQAKGISINVVLFHKASRVEEIDLKGGKIEAELGMYGEDGWEWLYRITELIPPVSDKKKSETDDFFDDLLEIRREFYDPDSRKTTLKIDLESIEVHDVESVKFKTTPHKVYKSRYEEKMKRKEVTDD